MESLPLDDFEKQDIKTFPISPSQLEEMHKIAGNYEALFSKRSMKYKSLGLNEKKLNENDFKHYILEEYTFLKRPVFIVENTIFIGNSKREIQKLSEKLRS